MRRSPCLIGLAWVALLAAGFALARDLAFEYTVDLGFELASDQTIWSVDADGRNARLLETNAAEPARCPARG